MEGGTARDADLVLATWACALHSAGISANDDGIRKLVAEIHDAKDAATGNAAGEKLMQAAGDRLRGSSTVAAVSEVLRAWYGEQLDNTLGDGDRDARLQRIRRYQFGRRLPWLARVWERVEGEVAPTWLIVDQVTDVVQVRDPNPWNDIDEERKLPLGEFMVVWELDGCSSVHVR